MKTKIIIALFVFAPVFHLFSQTIGYDYDENGNRTDRALITLKASSVNENMDTNIVNNNEELATIKEEMGGSKLSIYPNPTQNFVIVNIEDIDNKTILLNIYDDFGKTLEQKQIKENITYIDFTRNPSGYYFLKLTVDQKSKSWKIIKQ